MLQRRRVGRGGGRKRAGRRISARLRGKSRQQPLRRAPAPCTLAFLLQPLRRVVHSAHLRAWLSVPCDATHAYPSRPPVPARAPLCPATPARTSAPPGRASQPEELKWIESQGRTAGALWDIFRAEDQERLVEFLWKVAREEGTAERLAHPIHDANFYVDAAMRKRLWQEAGVQSYRFLQHKGEAVFVPAGCPHQAVNIRSSIKVAQDFVSPEHIGHCLELTEQFRALPRGHRRQEDNLGAKDIMLHAVSHALSVRGLTEGTADALSESSDDSEHEI